MGILDDVAKKVKDTKAGIDAGNRQTEGMGKELAAKAEMVRQGRIALGGPDSVTSVTSAPKPTPVTDSGKRYGDKPGEKRMDVREAMRPLGSFEHGTSHVPATGVYKLHKGEAVIPKEKNTMMDAKQAMEGIVGKSTAKPEKKIHKITTHKSDDGKMIHTHLHHHPQHHPDETHVSNNLGEAQDHMKAMEPNMSAQPPAMPEPGSSSVGAPATAPLGA